MLIKYTLGWRFNSVPRKRRRMDPRQMEAGFGERMVINPGGRPLVSDSAFGGQTANLTMAENNHVRGTKFEEIAQIECQV